MSKIIQDWVTLSLSLSHSPPPIPSLDLEKDTSISKQVKRECLTCLATAVIRKGNIGKGNICQKINYGKRITVFKLIDLFGRTDRTRKRIYNQILIQFVYSPIRETSVFVFLNILYSHKASYI